MLSKSPAKARDSNNRPASEIPYGLWELSTFSSLEGMQTYDSACSAGPDKVSKCMLSIVPPPNCLMQLLQWLCMTPYSIS